MVAFESLQNCTLISSSVCLILVTMRPNTGDQVSCLDEELQLQLIKSGHFMNDYETTLTHGLKSGQFAFGDRMNYVLDESTW